MLYSWNDLLQVVGVAFYSVALVCFCKCMHESWVVVAIFVLRHFSNVHSLNCYFYLIMRNMEYQKLQ